MPSPFSDEVERRDETYYGSNDPFLNFRHRAMIMFGWVIVPFLLPFLIYNLVQGRIALAILVFLLTAMGLVKSLYIKYNRKEIVPYWIFYVTKLFAIHYAIISLGAVALLWAYPICIAVVFVAKRSSIVFLLVVAYVSIVCSAFYHVELFFSARFAITLALVCFICYLLEELVAQAQNSLTQLAIRDPLTNAFNRRYMDETIRNAVEEIGRGFGPASLMLLDIDHFKKVNDTFGHEAGDEVLKELVSLLHTRQRRLDFVFRMGGEEFLVLLRNTEENQAIYLAEKLRSYIETREFSEAKKITISLGVAEYITGDSADDWIRRADDNLYAAKDAGRNCVYPPPPHEFD